MKKISHVFGKFTWGLWKIFPEIADLVDIFGKYYEAFVKIMLRND
jgi:hypothetical protein